MHDHRSPEIAEHLVPHHGHAAHPAHPAAERDLGFVLTGGGARGAYQVGVLRWIARHWPDLNAPILTGVSAGAVNTAKLAAHHGTFEQAVDELTELWKELTPDKVFRVDPGTMLRTAVRWGFRLMSGGATGPSNVRGFLDTAPLRELLEDVLVPVNGRISGIEYNLARGTLKAVALIATSYSTGQTVSFVQGRNVTPWIRPQRRTVLTELTVEHVMASAALPMFFPAVRVGDMWYGDGGVRLAAPLSPALHLGANRILAISTRYDRTQVESDAPNVVGYPPPAQVLGVLLNAVFLDLVDQDAVRLERLNHLLEELPPDKREGMRPVDLLVVRPSRDLGRLAAEFEPQLPKAFRFMTRGLGTRETKSPDLLSMLMFQPDYIARLIEIGEADAETRRDQIVRLMETETPRAATA
jgi:NTE family protein